MIKINNDDIILFLGDSITDVSFNRRVNRTVHGKNNYPLQVKSALKKAKLHAKVIIKGIASNRSYHVYDRLTADCIKLKPSVIVMLIGVNDAWENYVPEQYPPLLRPFEPHMSEIFRRIKAELPNAKLIVLTPFLISTIAEKLPFKVVLADFIAKIKELSVGYATEVIELQPIFDEAEKTIPPVNLAVDGVHPTALGHSYIAKAVTSKFDIK